MPCDSSHCEANGLEVELSRVLALLDELDGKGPPSEREWDGYGAGYGHATREALDRDTARLCKRLTDGEDVTNYSLEMQMWWRDHQKADQQKAKDAADAKRRRIEKLKHDREEADKELKRLTDD